MTAFIFAVVVLGIFSFFRVRRRVREARESAASGGSGGGRGIRVLVDDAGIAATAGDSTQRIAWHDLRSVHIESVAGGLNPDDVYWVLTPARGAAALRVAQTAPGADTMIARLQQFPGFRYEPMINSMITTEATRFLVWEHADD